MKLKLLTLLLILALFASTATATAITPTKDQLTSNMWGYDLQGQNNSYGLACEIGEFVSQEYGYNCDIRVFTFSNHTKIYSNVFYPASNNSKGYEACYGWFGPQHKELVPDFKNKIVYYKDFGVPGNTGCRIVGLCSYKTVKSYFGDNETLVSEDTTHDVAGNVTEDVCEDVNNTTEELNNTSDSVLDTANSISLFVENKTSGNSANITADLKSTPTKSSQNMIIAGLSNLIKGILGWD